MRMMQLLKKMLKELLQSMFRSEVEVRNRQRRVFIVYQRMSGVRSVGLPFHHHQDHYKRWRLTWSARSAMNSPARPFTSVRRVISSAQVSQISSSLDQSPWEVFV